MTEQEDWKKRYDSLMEGLKSLEAENKYLKEQNEVMGKQKRQWEEEKIKQQMIIKQQLGNSDDVVRQLQKEIKSIKKKLRVCLKKVK